MSSNIKTSTNSISSGDSSRDHTNTVKSNFSFFGGAVASIPLSRNIIFKPQLQYIVKGWTVEHDFINREDYDIKLCHMD
jgi:hypothetical protein